MNTVVPSRRGLLIGTGVLALPVLTALPAAPAEAAIPANWQALIRGVEWSGPRAGEAAMHAYRAGVDLDDLFCVAYGPLGGGSDPERFPALLFNMPGGRLRTFRPNGEDV